MSDHAGTIENVVAAWRRLPTDLEAGLSDDELAAVESAHQIRFPPDLRACLAEAHPVGEGFPNWRTGVQVHRGWDSAIITRTLGDVLAWPVEGVLFDVKHGAWRPEFGDHPADPAARESTAAAYLRSLPRLIPVYSHRYIPEQPCEAGNPVFSVWGTDVIYYGRDLAAYLTREFGPLPPSKMPESPVRRIPFWSDLAEDR